MIEKGWIRLFSTGEQPCFFAVCLRVPDPRLLKTLHSPSFQMLSISNS